MVPVLDIGATSLTDARQVVDLRRPGAAALALYPLIRKRLAGGLGLHPGAIPEQRAIIDASPARLAQRLGDGRRYCSATA